MATIKQAAIFRDEILPPVGKAAVKGNNLGGNLTGFLAQDGCLYSRGGGLMVVGRAVNGWKHDIDPVKFDEPDFCAEYAKELWEKSYPHDGKCPMAWVTKQWGATEGFNTQRSAFWRVIRQVTEGLGICSRDENWSSHLIWSNLYKVAPANGGNPNDTLCNAQYDGCKELLKQEIQDYCPRYLLFLTENPNPDHKHYWARPFLDKFKLSDWPGERYVCFTGRPSLPEYSDSTQIVGAIHPQGQNEDGWVKEVLDAVGSM